MTRHDSKEAILSLSGLDSYYGELQVLRQASLSIAKAEVVALFGPNGHGKSTLLKAISGINPPRKGTILFDGADITRSASDKIVEMGLAYIPEARNIFTEMTVLENLLMGGFTRGGEEFKQSLPEVFQIFPILEQRKNQMGRTLSGGEQQIGDTWRSRPTTAARLVAAKRRAARAQ